MSKVVPITASISAIIIHFTMYYGKISIPFTLSTGENPGVAAAVAIVASLIIGMIVLKFNRSQA